MNSRSAASPAQDSTTQPRRVYFDNAATSWPKPPQVLAAIQRFYCENGTPAFRGIAGQTAGTDQGISRCRQKMAEFVRAENRDEIVFTFNGTDSLNTVLLGTLGSTDHVVTTTIEHNSVLRPLDFLAREKQVDITYIEMRADGRVDPKKIFAALRPDTKLVCVSHVSNVTGVIQPVEIIGEKLREHPALFLVDAAQSLGHIEVDVKGIDCDFLAAPGHKGLFGPLGTGVLYVAERSWSRLQPSRFGGTGTQSDSDRQPVEMPTRLESGNLNVGGILGLEAGLDFVVERNVNEIHKDSSRLIEHAKSRLNTMSRVKIYYRDAPARSAALSFNVCGVDPREIASILESSFGIQSRAGLHCSPRIHRQMGTLENGGTVRISVGCFNTIDEIDVFVDAVTEIIEAI